MLVDALEAVSKEQSGIDAKVTKALAQFQKEVGVKAAMAEELGKGPKGKLLFDFPSLTRREVIAERRAVAAELLRLNVELLEFVQRGDMRIRELLVAENIRGDDLKRVVSGLDRYGSSDDIRIQGRIRSAENQMLTDWMQTLDLLDAEWGRWKLEAEGTIVFESSDASTTFDDLSAKVLKSSMEQKAAEQERLQQIKSLGK